ncbi:MAG: DUF4198 domain-containing protein [Paracoccaceae bacterium]
MTGHSRPARVLFNGVIGGLMVVALWTFGVAAARAHEFFIDAEPFVVPSGGVLTASLRVGEDFEGAAQAYLPPNFRRFDVVMGGQVVPVAGRAGDRPALNMPAPRDGLAVVVHVTRDYRLTYTNWSKFERFVTHKDAVWVLQAHQDRELNTDRVVERYSRYGKSLIAVGDGGGADASVGLLTEIVAEANPYTDPGLSVMPVKVLYQGQPRKDAQVEIFAKTAEGLVTVSTVRTDDTGRAQVPVVAGSRYLLDAVVLRPLAVDSLKDPTWESLWASLTFAVPARR